jgi:hypothetical protein
MQQNIKQHDSQLKQVEEANKVSEETHRNMDDKIDGIYKML